MHFPPLMVADWLLYTAMALALCALFVALARANWRALAAEPQRMHLVAGGAVACLLLWLLNIHGSEGPIVHFLGVTTLTLVVGWPFALIAGAAALGVFYPLQGLEWKALGLSYLLTVVAPATLSRWLAHGLRQTGIRHPFVYFLGAGFAGGALVALVLGLAALLLFWIGGQQEYLDTLLALWPMIALIMFSEGFINGMCVSALAVFYPGWVKTFDDRFYLDGK